MSQEGRIFMFSLASRAMLSRPVTIKSWKIVMLRIRHPSLWAQFKQLSFIAPPSRQNVAPQGTAGPAQALHREIRQHRQAKG